MIQGRKRTKITIKKASTPIIPLRFEDMTLDSGKGLKDYTYRLRYLNVPTVKQIKSKNGVLANRDDIVRNIHQALNSLPRNRSKRTYFSGLVSYFKYLDSIGYQGDAFSNATMIECIKFSINYAKKVSRKE